MRLLNFIPNFPASSRLEKIYLFFMPTVSIYRLNKRISVNWLGRRKSSSHEQFSSSWFPARPRHLIYCIVYSMSLQTLATFVNCTCPINITRLDKMNSHDPFTWTYSVSLMCSGEREKQQQIGGLTFSRLASVVALHNSIFQLHPIILLGSSFSCENISSCSVEWLRDCQLVLQRYVILISDT